MFRGSLLVSVALLSLVSFASAQDTIFVSCWSGPRSDNYRTRNVKSPTISSETAQKAYVSVKSTASGHACLNSTKLFVAGPTGEFRKVFQVEPNQGDDGNGMRLIGWNRVGTKLLAELGRWTYGSDTGMDRDVIIYDSQSGKLSKFDVAESLSRHFGNGCAFEFATKGWYETGDVVVEVTENRDSEDDDVKSCVQRATRFVVNLDTGAVNKLTHK
ncbi:MAG TPA: hypothetical protein VII23_10135 [Terriglobales bacterium]